MSNILRMAIIRGLEMAGNRISRKLKKSKRRLTYKEQLKGQERRKREFDYQYYKKYRSLNGYRAAARELEEWMLAMGCNKISDGKKRRR